MIPAMLAVMLWRYDEYTPNATRTARRSQITRILDGVPGGERVELAGMPMRLVDAPGGTALEEPLADEPLLEGECRFRPGAALLDDARHRDRHG